MIFSTADASSLAIIKGVPEDFALTSGLTMNMRRSSLFLGDVNDALRVVLTKMMGFERGQFPI